MAPPKAPTVPLPKRKEFGPVFSQRDSFITMNEQNLPERVAAFHRKQNELLRIGMTGPMAALGVESHFKGVAKDLIANLESESKSLRTAALEMGGEGAAFAKERSQLLLELKGSYDGIIRGDERSSAVLNILRLDMRALEHAIKTWKAIKSKSK